MATVHWSGMSGDWSTASDWSTDTVPGPSDRAVIAAAGSYTVTVTTPEDVGSVRLNDPGAILEIQPSGTLAVSGSLVVQSGTLDIQSGLYAPPNGLLAIGGTLFIRSGATLLLDGTIEGGKLIIGHGGTLIAPPVVAGYYASILQGVTVLGGLTLRVGFETHACLAMRRESSMTEAA